MKHKIWPTKALGSRVKFISGGTPRKSEGRFWGGDIPWISSAEMAKERIYETTHQVTSEGAINGTRLVSKDTILIVVRGMSLAKECRISLTTKKSTFNQDVKALRLSQDINFHFMFYYLKSQKLALRDAASEAAHGTKKLDMPVLEQWPFPLIPLVTQKKIAAILSAYDDLIENNKRRISVLEQMAEEIYREWFVRFRFPGYKQAEFEKGIPKGWGVNKIKDVASFLYGYTESSCKNNELPKFLRVMDINKKSFISWSDVPNCPIDEVKFNKYTLSKYDIVIARMADPGKVAIIESDVNAVFASYLIKINYDIEKLTPYYFFYTLRSDSLSKNFSNADSGATRGSINAQAIGGMFFFLPEKKLMNRFEAIVSPLREEISCLDGLNENLEKTKNQLLPRLISGKLSVDDLDIQFPPSMLDNS